MYKIRIKIGDKHLFFFPHVESFVEFLNKNGITKYRCCSGLCGTCKIKLIKGIVENIEPYYYLNDKEINLGYILPCVTLVRSDLEITI
ncbi:hypothetical protein [uncultured Gammaproteobacteria bacterium]|jgi:ferredoxin|nr:hypothetical protein [uncultured Gammaproteobacteria bacterium]CAC9953502.1 hypothetical protein [uncultured Gammaproteobacteria bacterium]CAC9964598.1 hypothetical protein [uncultured Gammaproteobacteria bacterium]